MSNFFKSKTKSTDPTFTIAADDYGAVREPLIKWLNQKIGKPAEQYPSDKLVADKTPQEEKSVGFVDQYADQGQNKNVSLASQEVQKTLSGNYDPTSSPYYQAVKAEAARNLEEAQSDIADRAAGTTGYWRGSRVKAQADTARDYALGLNKLLYGMAEDERVRRLQTVPVAQQLGAYEEAAPLRKATALQELGSLDRQINQARNDAIYNEWLRATQEYPLNVATLAANVQQPPDRAQRQFYKEPSPYEKYLRPIISPTIKELLNVE